MENIGIVTTWFERGAAYVSKQIKTSLEESGHKVFVYARGGELFAEGDPTWDTPEVTWGKTHPKLGYPKNAIDDIHLLEWVRSNKICSVIFNEQTWWSNVSHLSKNGVKVGAYIDYYTETTVPFFGIYDFLICNTKRHFSVFDWHPQVFYVPWGTDLSLYKPSESRANKPLTFFHSAGFNPFRKGTDLLLRAFAKVKGNCKLIIHAQVKLGTHFPELDKLISELVDVGKLEVIEASVTAPGLYYKGDVYVYPSRLDGIGLTVAEAIASGLPVITTDYAPMNEFVNETNGKLVSVNKVWSRADGYYWPQCEVDIDSLTMAMNFYVDCPEMSEIKVKTRAYAEQYLNWQKNAVVLSCYITESNIIDRTFLDKLYKNAEAFDMSHVIRQHWKDQLIENYWLIRFLKKITG